MPRKHRKDITVGQLEKKLGIPSGSIRKQDGTKWRKDARLKTVRKSDKK